MDKFKLLLVIATLVFIGVTVLVCFTQKDISDTILLVVTTWFVYFACIPLAIHEHKKNI